LNVGGRLHARYQQAFDVGQQSSRQTVTVREIDLGDDQTMGLRGLVDVFPDISFVAGIPALPH
jgi:hypothetical protein